jgi:hypothetical protein
MIRLLLGASFTLALVLAQFRSSGLDDLVAWLEVTVEDAGARPMPARLYIFKDGRPFRLSPVEAMLPLRVDLFYRERLWRSGEPPKTLEVTALDQSHFLLLNGKSRYALPQGSYRLEAYRGIFYKPASEEFKLEAGKTQQVRLRLDQLDSSQSDWLAADDHIHLTRAPEDNALFLDWLAAEDLAVGNFLQLQRQMDASPQYAFGTRGEATRPGYSIRPGHESRSEYFGHINLLGGREIVRPLSVGTMYANTPGAYPFPSLLFEQGRKIGATVGFAHFDGSTKHSTVLMDLARGSIDFIEVFQFGVLKSDAWYQLLNAGLRVTGIAGSDFPVPINRSREWPRAIPLLGPERALVKAKPGASAYEAWATGVRAGRVVVSNGPLLDFTVNGKDSGATVNWTGDSITVEASARARSHRPIVKTEILINGRVVASSPSGAASFSAAVKESSWIAARVQARHEQGEPEIWAHANPIYLLRDNRPVRVDADRQAVAARWRAELDYYRSPEVPFATDAQRRELLQRGEEALRKMTDSQ